MDSIFNILTGCLHVRCVGECNSAVGFYRLTDPRCRLPGCRATVLRGFGFRGSAKGFYKGSNGVLYG